jgi:tRNA threonylcarbamoyladenosine biosynthesis protein TsaE
MLKYQNLNLKQVQRLATEPAKQFRNRGGTIGLVGPLGSGKTTFIKAFARALGVKQVASPTFVISHEHKIAQGKLFHLDFYRLKNTKQLVHLGLSEMQTKKNIVVIEWIDRIKEVIKQANLIIYFKVRKNNNRDVTIKTL